MRPRTGVAENETSRAPVHLSKHTSDGQRLGNVLTDYFDGISNEDDRSAILRCNGCGYTLFASDSF